jgi:hypothetical protein
MLQMRDHGVEDYTALLDMDATDVGVMTEDDRACLDELGEYLVTTESWRRFAVWLLHKYFEPADGQIFVERAASENQTIETTLVARSVLSPQGVRASGWRWRLGEGETQPEVMQECSAGCVAVGESQDLRHRHAGTDNDDNPIDPGPFTNRFSADSADWGTAWGSGRLTERT